MNVDPKEVITGPMELWIGIAGVMPPATNEEPDPDDWTKVGTSGNRNYTEDGVVVQLPQSIEYWRGLGSTLPIKATRTSEDGIVTVTIADLSLEQFKLALNNNSITTTAAASGVAGVKSINLYRGPNVATFALLARGPSPYFATGYGQFYLPVVVADGSPEMTWSKSGDPAAWELEVHVMADLDADEAAQAGKFEAMTAEPLT
jgi:hypothetical protein